jgi:hypothetical protein
MSTTPQKPARDGRRAKFAMYSMVLVLSTLLVVAFLNILSSRYSFRLDVTATGDQRLAPRTTGILESLRGPHEIVIAARLASLDRQSLQRVKDTLSEFEHRSGNVKSRLIDTGTAGGRDQFVQFVASLVARDRAALDVQTRTVNNAIEHLGALGAFLGSDLSKSLLSLRDAMTGEEKSKVAFRQFFEQTAAAARLSSQDLESSRQRATAAMSTRIEEVALPATDAAAKDIASVLQPTADEFDALFKQLRVAQTETGLPAPLAAQIKALADDLQSRRDSMAMIADTLSRLPRLDVLRVVDTLKNASACVVIGPKEGGLTAIDLDMLIPDAATVASASLSGVDIGRKSEDLFSIALGSLAGRAKPVVVILHAEPRAILGSSNAIAQLSQRLGMRGIDIVEWAIALHDQPPGLSRLNPDGKRPVVYVSVPPDSAAAGDSKGQLTGGQRAEKLGTIVDRLADEGKNILLGVFPSVLPTTGNVDPTTRVLDRFGLAAYSGRTLVRDVLTPQGRYVETDFTLQPTPGHHPICHAIQGLPMLLSWPIDIAIIGEPMQDVKLWSLLTLPTAEGTWSEAQWLRFWSTPAHLRPQIADAPTFDRHRDLAAPTNEPGKPGRPWTLGMAAERTSPSGLSQRLIVIGANGWFIDRFTFRTSPVDGRLVVAFPGNLELFEASIAWLANQDDTIAQSPAARVLPVVQPITRGTLLAAQWFFIAGLPALALVAGLLHRWIRG